MEINKEDFNHFFTVPVKLATLSHDYVQNVLKDLKRDIYKSIYDGEMHIENMKYGCISQTTTQGSSHVENVQGWFELKSFCKICNKNPL